MAVTNIVEGYNGNTDPEMKPVDTELTGWITYKVDNDKLVPVDDKKDIVNIKIVGKNIIVFGEANTVAQKIRFDNMNDLKLLHLLCSSLLRLELQRWKKLFSTENGGLI